MVEKQEVAGYIETTFLGTLASIQPNEVFQLIELILACLSFLITISYTIYKWYKRAKADGKITQDEVDELIDDLHDKTKDHKEDR